MSSQFKEFWNEVTRDYSFHNRDDRVVAKRIAEKAWNAALDKSKEAITNSHPKPNMKGAMSIQRDNSKNEIDKLKIYNND